MFLTMKKCDGQGDCIKNCPSEAIRYVDNKAFSCMCCGACYEACPNHAIFKNKYGGYVVDRAKCNGCGVCQFTCPIDSIHLENGIVKGICSRCGVCEDVCSNHARVDTFNLLADKQQVMLNSFKRVAATIGSGAGVKRIDAMNIPSKTEKTAERICVNTDSDKCVLCGRCSYYCPTEAIEIELDREGVCTSCRLCDDVCPTGAISEGVVDSSKCALCLACVNNCINNALSVKDFNVVSNKAESADGVIVSCLNCGLCVETFDDVSLRKSASALRYDPYLDEDSYENRQKRLNAIDNCPVSTLNETYIFSLQEPNLYTLKEDSSKLNGLCVSCGKCIQVCDVHNARSFETISWNGEVSDDCISCGICAELCPKEAISLKKGSISVDLDSCIMCETCAIHCPKDAIPKSTNVKWEISGGFNYIDENLCVKCGLCKDICPEDAIYTEEISGDEINMGTRNRKLRFVVDDDKCIYCGACKNICPSKSFIFEREFEEVTFKSLKSDDEPNLNADSSAEDLKLDEGAK